MGKKASSGHGAGPECLIAAGELESERSGMERATGGGGASDKEAESATNEEAEPFAEDGRYPNDNNRAAAGSALPLAATIDVMAATGEDNEEDVEEGESGALNRDRMREGCKRAMLELEQTEGCSSAATRRREVSKAPAATQPVSIHMARVNAPFDAALAALDAAGIRKQKIDGLILIQKQELGRLADILKNKGRGRPNKDHTEQVKAASARIMRLERNVLPDESEPKGIHEVSHWGVFQEVLQGG